VSACVSSLIPSAVRHPGGVAAMAAISPQALLEALISVAHPGSRCPQLQRPAATERR
jgi:hypothetical protein